MPWLHRLSVFLELQSLLLDRIKLDVDGFVKHNDLTEAYACNKGLPWLLSGSCGQEGLLLLLS